MENNEKSIVLAFDLGASSGRAVVGILRDSKLELKNLYRFPNSGIRVSNSYCWDTIRIYQEMLHSMHLFVKEHGTKLDSLALDSWGVDYVLLNEYDELAGPVYHYRDKRTEGILEQMFKKIPKEEIYKTTGIQFMSLNTSSQLYSMVVNKSPQLSITRYFLMIPDYFNFLFTGRKTSEFSIASTSQLYDPVKKDWANALIKKLGLNPNWFPEIVQPGTFVGFLNEDIRNDCGLEKGTRVIAPLCHDTGSAVVAVPVDTSKYKEKEWAYLSSGTWSLLGVELEKPLINEKALIYNYTNEGGINQTFRFLKNITGMWLIQECKRIWEIDSPSLEWDDIVSLTEKSNEFQYFIDINDSRFNNPTNMITELQDYCKETNQVFPSDIGSISRGIFESLALSYRHALEKLELIIESEIKILHVIGGGSSNALLNQFTANCLKIPVMAGPVEATAIGNILVQFLSLGKIRDINQLREIVRKSFDISEYQPKKTKIWDDAYKDYLELVSKT